MFENSNVKSFTSNYNYKFQFQLQLKIAISISITLTSFKSKKNKDSIPNKTKIKRQYKKATNRRNFLIKTRNSKIKIILQHEYVENMKVIV